MLEEAEQRPTSVLILGAKARIALGLGATGNVNIQYNLQI